MKEAVFPFNRFPGVDIVLGPEMKSTGEVMGLDFSFARAFAKSQLGAGLRLPTKGTVFVSVKDKDKAQMIEPCRKLAALGFRLLATVGTAEYLSRHGIAVERVNKVSEGRPHVVDAMKDGAIQLVFNTVEGPQALADSFSLRQAALLGGIAYYTTAPGARASVAAIADLASGELEVAPLQAYF